MTVHFDPTSFDPTGDAIERGERRPVAMRGFVALSDGQTAEILVLDLSYEGCGIETPVELLPGQSITLAVLNRGAIQAEVKWYRQGKAGLVFESETEAQVNHRERKGPRVYLHAEVKMRRLGRANYRVRLFDLSPHGCKLERIGRPMFGEHVLVRFEGIEALQGEVCWVEAECVGLRFTYPIHPAVFDLLVQRLSQAPSTKASD